MVDIDQSIVIEAPPEEVFDYIADPHNHETFTPSIVGIDDVEDADVGKAGAYTFRMAGVTMDGRFNDVAFDRPNRRAYELTGDIEGRVAWHVESTDGGSRVRYESSVSFPGPDLLERITEPVVERFSRNEVRSALENLQAIIEESGATTTSPS